jgi:asparagine synthase (glutamine-hydrolysing)
MCGIVGYASSTASITKMELSDTVARMANTLHHRGPDGSGTWVDQDAGIGLGHRRLAVIDLSEHGRQPMISASGRYVVTFNGEIYNFHEIRHELDTIGVTQAWRGHSDTEVLLAAIDAFGLDITVNKCVGMFAFALWDRAERVLHLVRDRLGEKPLYYGLIDGVFVFGSELKSLRIHPGWQGEIDRDALAMYMRYSYIPSPYSIYKGIYKLVPGTILSLPRQWSRSNLPTPKPYWSAKAVAERGIGEPFSGNETEAQESLEKLIKHAVGLQMVADVPLGAFLSGGVDSSTIVALMQAQSARPVRTFTIGFHEQSYNEAVYAKAVADHLGTEHTELYVTHKDAIEIVPRLSTLYDEPFSDSSQIPTFLVSQLARQHVTVSLSGDGGDELFGGYNWYGWSKNIWRSIGWMPKFIRNAMAKTLSAASPQTWDAVFSCLAPLLPKAARITHPGDKLHKLAAILPVNNPEEVYLNLITHWKNSSEIVAGVTESTNQHDNPSTWPRLPEFIQRMMYQDLVSYLPDDILVKVDRAAMGVSLETRVPLLDHRVVEFAWRLPLSMKMRKGGNKWLLRQVLYKYVPKELIERPKMGFGMPIDGWLRGPLRDWAESLLSEERLVREGYLNAFSVRRKWQEHVSGKRNWQYKLWDVLMFQNWLDHTAC